MRGAERTKLWLPVIVILLAAHAALAKTHPDLKNCVAILERSDGATDHESLASALDGLRSLGAKAAPAAETLSRLLPHQSKLYADRDKTLVSRLRAYIVVTLSEIGYPSSAFPTLLDTLAHVDERVSPVEVGAAARAAGSLGPRGRQFAPYLVETLTVLRFSAEEFSLERFDPLFPADEATTVQIEAVRALGRVCIAEDHEVLDALDTLAKDVNPRIATEARRAMTLIQSRKERT